MKTLFGLMALVSLVFSSVDINTADVKELSSLKGIGVSKAKMIVEFRKAHCFKTIDQLSLVKGIGKKTIEKNRDNLSASECKISK
jgi:competence protein ComEA